MAKTNPRHEYVDQLDAVRQKIKKYFDFWFEALCLHSFTIRMVWEYERGEDPRVTAKANVQWEYLRACVTFYLPNCVDKDDEEMEEVVVHELMHVLLNEMREYDKNRPESIDHEERVASMLQRSFSNVRKSK